jgi:CheY-like chemotaxis protein
VSTDPLTLRILVLDDDPLWRRIIGHTLSKQDAHVVDVLNVSTVEEAAIAIDDAPFDLVLVDYELPDGHGLDLLDRCDRDRMQRIVLVTGFADLQDLEDDRASLVDGYLTKPFLSSDLVACLRGLVPLWAIGALIPAGYSPGAP